jgi:hypothetical protein
MYNLMVQKQMMLNITVYISKNSNKNNSIIIISFDESGGGGNMLFHYIKYRNGNFKL